MNATKGRLSCVVFLAAGLGVYEYLQSRKVSLAMQPQEGKRAVDRPVAEPAKGGSSARRFEPAVMSVLVDPETAAAYFRKLGVSEMRRALEYLASGPIMDPSVKATLLAALFQGWTENDLPGAIAAAEEYDTTKWALLQGWARLDPRAAWNWAGNLQQRSDIDGFYNSIVIGGVKGGRESNVAELVIERLQSPPDRNYHGLLVSRLAEAWGDKDPTQTLEWLKRVEGIDSLAAVSAARNMGDILADMPLPEFAALLSGQSERIADAILGKVVQEWVSQNQLDRLTQFVSKNSEISDNRRNLIAASMGNALESDEPDLALRIYRSISDTDERDRSIAMGAMRLSGQGEKKSKTALMFALAVENEAQRISLLKKVYKTFVDRYPEEARTALSLDSFPREIAALLEKSMPR